MLPAKHLPALLVLLLSTAPHVWGQGQGAEEDTVVLTAQNFDSVINKHEFVLAAFYAPWCGYCKRLLPEYEAAATKLKALASDVVLAKIDCTIEESLAKQHGVNGYPTIKWYSHGGVAVYNGPRETDDIVAWVMKKSRPPVVFIQDASHLQELEKASAPASVVVGYFDATEGSDYAAFKTVAQSMDDVTFVATTKKEVAAVAGLTAPGVAAIQNFEGEPRTTTKFGINAAALQAWATVERMPPYVVSYTLETMNSVFESSIRKQVFLYGSTKDVSAGSPSLAAFKAVSRKFVGRLTFVTVDADAPTASIKITKMFGFKGAKLPVVAAAYGDRHHKYAMEGEITEAAIEAFAESVLAGTAKVAGGYSGGSYCNCLAVTKPWAMIWSRLGNYNMIHHCFPQQPDGHSPAAAAEHYKSQPTLDNPKDEGVTVVTGKTFDDIVLDANKDVMLLVYAPWCGHCIRLLPTYQQLAERFSKVGSVVIAQWDDTLNEYPGLQVGGYPTILFKPAGKSSHLLEYGGPRDLQALIDYVHKEARIPFPRFSPGREFCLQAGAEGTEENVNEL